MRALRRLLARLTGRALEISVYTVIAAATGMALAWYTTAYGSPLTVEVRGVWQRWTIAGAPGADPYTKAHFARLGFLPITTAQAHYHIAHRDSTGEPLYADCEYTVSGPVPPGRRWTLAAFDLDGRMIDPGPGRAVMSSANAVTGPGGDVSITLSQTAQPGNWLSLTGAKRVQLLLTVYGRTLKAVGTEAQATASRSLPDINRTGCR